MGIRLVRNAPSANVTLQADAGLSFNLKNIEPFTGDPGAFASLNSKIQTAIGRDVLAPNRQTAKLYDLTEQQLTNLLVVLDWAIDQSEARQRST